MKPMILILLLLLQTMNPGSVRAWEHDDVRVYLNNGSVFSGTLVELGPELIIARKNGEIFTFEVEAVKQVVTLESLGEAAQTVSVRTFPRAGFLAVTFAGATLAWWGFDNASGKEKEALDNERANPPRPAQAEELRDDADTSRLIAWSGLLAGAAFLAVALIPEWTEKRVFPDQVEVGHKSVRLLYAVHF
ncbi:MAG: hypothetical protein V1800_15555 [Candidatus Latescibacterota bacterium]